jgi:DNA-binding MarR family transcriptional regulator
MSRHKREVFEELVAEVRASQSATERFDQAVADALGINRTDMRTLDLLQQSGVVNAGKLAERTGLTTGAMTTALDRLERAGYARRVRDSADRRRVLVETTERASKDAQRFYGEHAQSSERLYDRYTQDDLELLLGFVREGRVFNEEHAARVERENRARNSD